MPAQPTSISSANMLTNFSYREIAPVSAPSRVSPSCQSNSVPSFPTPFQFKCPASTARNLQVANGPNLQYQNLRADYYFYKAVALHESSEASLKKRFPDLWTEGAARKVAVPAMFLALGMEASPGYMARDKEEWDDAIEAWEKLIKFASRADAKERGKRGDFDNCDDEDYCPSSESSSSDGEEEEESDEDEEMGNQYQQEGD